MSEKTEKAIRKDTKEGKFQLLPTLSLYVIADIVAQEYSAPFVNKNDETAKRYFNQMLKSSTHNWSEFELLEVGSFNPNIYRLGDPLEYTREIGTFCLPRLVQRGSDVVRS